MACAFAGYYIFRIGTKTQCKEIFYRFLREIPDVDKAVEDFWSENFDGIFDWYNKIHDSSDIVISASPEFLLEGAAEIRWIVKTFLSQIFKRHFSTKIFVDKLGNCAPYAAQFFLCFGNGTVNFSKNFRNQNGHIAFQNCASFRLFGSIFRVHIL